MSEAGHPIGAPRSGGTRSRRRRRRGGGTEIEHNPDRWMASYMDVVTVLMCMFIVLYAMSTVDEEKYAALRESLSQGFGNAPSTPEDAIGVLQTDDPETPDLLSDEGEQEDQVVDELLLAQQELDDLRELKRRIREALREAGHEGSAEFVLDSNGLTIRMVGAETFFNSNVADLRPEGIEMLDAIAPVLAPAGRNLEIGGHADYRRPMDTYPTNWELSGARATAVLRQLVEEGDVDPTRIISVGYGHEHPISDDDLQQNRRVDVTVLSDQPETVRELMEELGQIEQGGSSDVSASGG